MHSPTQTQSPSQAQIQAQIQAQAQNQSMHQRQWYIQVDQQNYGPFDDATLWAFMCEGRVNAQSLISQYPNTAYRPVSADPGLMGWLNQTPQNLAAQAQSAAQPTAHQQPAQQQIAQTQQQTQAAPAAVNNAAQTVFMIMAEIKSGRGMEFLQTLQSLGDVERIGDTVWILKARASSEDIRNVLCQPLGADDRLFVMDSFANETAWFNLGAQMDARVRELWDVSR